MSSASSTDSPRSRLNSARQAAKAWASSSPPKSATGVTAPVTSAPAIDAHPATMTTTAEAPLQPTLPSAETQRQVDEARAAVVASMRNLLDTELQSRAAMLHEGAAGLERQEREVARATEALRRERERLAHEADAAAKKVKELGNVQNWAEVLERGFLVLEETVRLANDGSEGSGSGSDASCSCSDCGRDDAMDLDKDEVAHAKADDVMAGADPDGSRSAWSEASRSLLEPDSSTGSGRIKGSETASLSTGSLRDGDGRQLGGT